MLSMQNKHAIAWYQACGNFEESIKVRQNLYKRIDGMNWKRNLVINAFQAFMKVVPEHTKAWAGTVPRLNKANILDKKTQALSYLAALAALNRTSEIPFHVQPSKEAGVSREEAITAILVGLPAASHLVK